MEGGASEQGGGARGQNREEPDVRGRSQWKGRKSQKIEEESVNRGGAK